MTRSSLRLWATTGLLFVFIACAKAEGGSPVGDGDGDGDTALPGSGGVVSSSTGGVTIGASGGATSGSGGGLLPMGGATASGGTMNLGGAGTGGASFDGQCSGIGTLKEATATGDKGVHVCTLKQSACPEEAVGVPALFECVSSHFPNCTSQDPSGGDSWLFIGLCSEEAMGGASN